MSPRRNRGITDSARAGHIQVAHDYDKLWAAAVDNAYANPDDWWDDEIPTHPGYTWAHWQTAFADTTLDVSNRVWRSSGARLYATHRDALLRDDLQSWLTVKAQEIANQYTPNRHAEDPERYWGGYLWKALHGSAEWHFSKAVGAREQTSGIAAREAHARGIRSIDAMTEALGDGWVTDRMVLHGDPLNVDPLSMLIRLEQLEHDVDRARQHYTPEWGNGRVYVSSSFDSTGVCMTNGCERPTHLRGMCRTCYERDRVKWANTKGYVCSVPDCGNTHKGHGFCATHLLQHKKGTLAEEHLHLYEESRPRGKRGVGTCTHEGCDNPSKSRSLCHKHYVAARREVLGTCSAADDCQKKVFARGMCSTHYYRARKAEDEE